VASAIPLFVALVQCTLAAAGDRSNDADECYDDVRRRVYPGTSQRIISNRDHKFSKWLPWATLVYALPLYLAATGSPRFSLQNVIFRTFSEILRLRKG
jgi:hypothetical protein